MRKNFIMLACLFALLGGCTSASNSGEENNIQIANPIVDTTIEEATKQLGFGIVLPSDLKIIEVEVIGDTLLQIEVEDEDNQFTLRKAIGTEDISGCYTEFKKEEQVEDDNYFITLKGTEDDYSLATWNDETYSYSLNCKEPVSYKELVSLINEIK